MHEVVSFSTTIDISSIAAYDPNAGLSFVLLENWSRQTNTQLFVDNVSVNAVPIPSAVFLFGAGLAGLAALRKKYGKLESKQPSNNC